jgi:hypothetical protein
MPAQIISAANSDPKVWLKFLALHPELSEQTLQKVLVVSLRDRKTKAVVNLLRHGVDPNGSHLGKTLMRLLEAAIHAISGRNPRPASYQYMDLLIHAKADVNIDGLIFYFVL